MNQGDRQKDFEDFLRVQVLTNTHKVSRAGDNNYHCSKTGNFIERKETTSEYVLGCLRLADFYLTTYGDVVPEFACLDRLTIYELLQYHDDIEGDDEIDDVSIAHEQKRIIIEQKEIERLPIYAQKYPTALQKKFLDCDREFREKKTHNSIFSNSIDKLQPIIYATPYPEVWGASKGFDEAAVRRRSQPSFEPFPIIMQHFEMLMEYFNKNGHFDE